MKHKIILVRLIWISALILIASFFLWNIIVPFGRARYTEDFRNNQYEQIGRVKPINRTLPLVNTGQTIIGSPVYFTLNVTRPWQEAKVKVKYRTSPNFPHKAIDLGLLVNKPQWQFVTKPLESKTLDELANNWSRLDSNGETLYQRQPVFSSIVDFKQHPPESSQIALFNDSLPIEQSFASVPEGKNSLQESLVGGWQFFTTVNSGELVARFGFNEAFDPNIKKSKTEVFLYQGKNLIKIFDLSPRRDEIDNDGWWVYTLQEKNLPAGYYRLELRTDDNLITKSLDLNQTLMSFVGRLHFASDQKGIKRLWTTSREVSFMARRAESVGDVFIDGERQIVTESLRQFKFETKRNLAELRLEKAGLELAGDGVFAFDQSGLFDPRQKQIDYLTNLEQEKINFVLARYVPPAREGEWRVAEATFDFRKAVKDNDGYKFMLSIPGFTDPDNQADWLEIGRVEVDLKGEKVWQMAKRITKNWIIRHFLP